MENLWANVEQGTASLQQYLASMQVRQDTKLSLMSGLLLGTVVVVIIAIYPGKPIDYSQDGVELPEEMRGGEQTAAAAASIVKPKKEKTEKLPPPRGEQEILARIKDQAGLRQRRAPPPAHDQDGGQIGPGDADTKTMRGDAEDWSPAQLNEDKLAKRIGSSKAARMLGLTEEQIRQAVIDAKEEMQSGGDGSTGGHSFTRRGNSDDGRISLSGTLSLVIALLGLACCWLFLSTNINGPLARFLMGVFPREMATLGLSGAEGTGSRDHL